MKYIFEVSDAITCCRDCPCKHFSNFSTICHLSDNGERRYADCPLQEYCDTDEHWHTGIPSEKGWYVCKLKGVDIYETHNFTVNNWCEHVEKWQKIAKEEASNG